MTDIDGRIVGEFVAGADVPDIAQRYAVPEAYVDRVIEETSLTKRKHGWSFNSLGNRVVYSVLAGLVVNLATGIYLLGTVITVVLFVLTSAIVGIRRR